MIQRRRRLLKYGPSVYVVKCRFSMNSLSVPFGRRSLWTPPKTKKFKMATGPKAGFYQNAQSASYLPPTLVHIKLIL